MRTEYHNVSDYEAMTPTEALQKHLENAQLSHRICLAKALHEEKDPAEQCALSFGEVYHRFRSWAEYRAPFKTQEAISQYQRKWPEVEGN